MNDRLTEDQKKLIISNYRLLDKYIKYAIKNKIVPNHLEDEFISDMYIKFCISALKFDAKKGFKFSTYAYGGFGLGLKDLVRKKRRNERINYFQEIDDESLSKCRLGRKKDQELKIEFINEFLNNVVLTSKERLMLEDYYYNKLSFSKLGNKYSLSKEGSRLVVQRALKKLKKAALKKDLNIDDFYI